VGELVEAFKRLALERRDDPPPARDFLSIEGEPELSLVMDRPLFTPEAEVVIAAGPEAEGRPSAGTDALYDIDSVDLAELSGRLSALLLESPQASLSEATSRFPVTQGAAEIIGYLSLAEEAGQSAVWGESRAGIEARNERRGSRLLVDSPDPSYLPEGKP
jgi:hypothetical protein